MKRRVLATLALTTALTVVPAGTAAAHVHGITPLLKLLACGRANANAGANAAQGAPISGLIPSAEFGTPGQSPLGIGDGGFNALVGACS